MTQKELLETLAAAVTEWFTRDPDSEPALPVGKGYRIRYDTERLGAVSVMIVPHRIGWTRLNRSRVKSEHRIDVILYGRIEEEEKTGLFEEELERLAAWLLLAYRIQNTPCVGVETIDGAEAGYDRDAINETPMCFFGGIRATFATV